MEAKIIITIIPEILKRIGPPAWAIEILIDIFDALGFIPPGLEKFFLRWFGLL